MVTEIEAPSSVTGMSQDELIKRFAELDERVRSLGAERRAVAMELALIASQNRGEQSTVHLTSTAGTRVKCQFGSETEYISQELLEVSKMIGPELFDSLFESRIEFKAHKRELKKFLNTAHPDERLQTAKQLIRDATLVKDKMPYVVMEV